MKNKSKNKKLLDFIISFLIIVYVLIRIFFVQFFFQNKIIYGNITYRFNSKSLYTSSITENKIKAFLDKTTNSITENPFYDKNVKVDICFCSSRRQYAFWNPLTAFRGSLATATNLFSCHNIMLSNPDFETFEVSFKNVSTRKINDIISHEMTHCFLREKYNFFKRLNILPKWKEEGIAEAIASSSTYEIAKGVDNLLAGVKDKSPTYNYFKYRLCVLYLQKEKNMSFSQIIDSKEKYSAIVNEIKKYSREEILNWFD